MIAVNDGFAQRIDEALRKCREQMRRQVCGGGAGSGTVGSQALGGDRAVAVVDDDEFSLRLELEMRRLKGGASRSTLAAPPARQAARNWAGDLAAARPEALPTDDSSRVVSLSAVPQPKDDALAALVRAWPALPAPIRSAVTGLVRAHLPSR